LISSILLPKMTKQRKDPLCFVDSLPRAFQLWLFLWEGNGKGNFSTWSFSIAKSCSIDVVLDAFFNWYPNDLLTVFRREFDIAFLESESMRHNISFDRSYLDISCVVNKIYPNIIKFKSTVISNELGLVPDTESDVDRIANIWISCLKN